MRNAFLSITASSILLSACAQTATIPLAQNMVQITASAAPVCGVTGAQKVALRTAAIETINRGYDRFIINGAEYQNNVRVVGHTPLVANTSFTGSSAFSSGTAVTTLSGGQPIIGGNHDQGLIVKMFRENDAEGKNAVSARQTLGPKWQEIIKDKNSTCFD